MALRIVESGCWRRPRRSGKLGEKASTKDGDKIKSIKAKDAWANVERGRRLGGKTG